MITRTYQFITYLRVLSMFLIAWPHFTAIINPDWKFLHFIQWLFNNPLSITQNFGALGVCIFFLITGFLLADNKDSILQFVIKKLTKIYFPVLLSMFLFVVFDKIFNIVFKYESYWSQFSYVDWIKSATLYYYWAGIPDYVNGVLWYLFSLAFLFFFYILWLCLKHCSKIKNLAYFVVFTDFCMLLLYLAIDYFEYQGVRNYISFTAIPLFGYLINLLKSSQISMKSFVISMFFNYCILVYGFFTFQRNLYQSEPYLTSVLLAVLLFSLTSLLKKQSSFSNTTLFLEKISFSFYLTHSLYGGFIISLLYKILPYGICVLAGFGSAIVAAYVNYKLIEKLMKFLPTFFKNFNITLR